MSYSSLTYLLCVRPQKGSRGPDVQDVPRVSQGSFFQEQMSRPVRRMAWSWCLSSRPLRVDCQWQKLFSVWSAWWLITSPSWEIQQIKADSETRGPSLPLICTSAYLTCKQDHYYGYMYINPPKMFRGVVPLPDNPLHGRTVRSDTGGHQKLLLTHSLGHYTRISVFAPLSCSRYSSDN